MVGQGVKLKVNKECREAIENGQYLDPIVDSERLLDKLFTENLARKEKELKQGNLRTQLRYAIQRCLQTDDIDIFVGYTCLLLAL